MKIDIQHSYQKEDGFMDIKQIKGKLFKEATIFKTGGFRPTEELGESWIGKVLWGTEQENIPSQFDPIFTLFLNDLPYCPEEIKHYQLITISLNFAVFDHLVDPDLSPFFKINCYTSLEELQKINAQSTLISPFPLTAEYIKNDTPSWDSGFIETDLEDEIIRLEEDDGQSDFNYYDDIVEEMYSIHKVGGYPSFSQSGVSFGDDYPFVFQISSDYKAQFNIVDDGNFYFFYNKEKDDWIVYCDFY